MNLLSPTTKYWLAAAFLLLISFRGASQDYDVEWDASYQNLTWKAFVEKVEARYPVRFFYEADSLPDFNVIIRPQDSSLVKQLNIMLRPYRRIAVLDHEGNIFVTSNTSLKTAIPPETLIADTRENTAPVSPAPVKTNGALMETNGNFAGQRVTVGKLLNDSRSGAIISGYVRNANDNAPIIGVMIRIDGTTNAVLTDASGFYTLKVEKGDLQLIAGNIETKEKRINLKVLSDGRLDLTLEPRLVTLNAVVISAAKDQLVKTTQMGFQRLTTREIKEIPLVLGEQDVIKVSLLLPGVQSVGEGSAGLNVRGSPTDQNYFIINNIPVYNSSHLLGFFSAFNSDAIKDFTLYKGNIPAGFGGRLASVFDIRTKQGNQNNFSANGGISPVTARLTLEGPIFKKRSSYMIGVRSTYSDWILKQVNDPDISNSNAWFGDVITNFTFDLDRNNRINLSSYHSVDQIDLIDQNKYQYANNGASVSYNHLFREKNSFTLSGIVSRYDFTEQNAEIAIAAYSDYFSLLHGEIKSDITIRSINHHTITAGINGILYIVNQGDFKPLNAESMVNAMNLEKEKAIESGIYLSDEWTVTPKLALTGGIRYNKYFYLGPQQVNQYTADAPRSVATITDTITFSNNELIKTYGAPDFRFNARYLISERLSVKLGYNQLKQYLFMLSNTIAIAPTDKWKLCDYHIRPMSGEQYSFGIYSTLLNGKLEVSAETYYKTVKNLVEYKNGANLVVNEIPETEVIQGSLSAMGLEVMISKPKGRFNGWMNYTYSSAMVTLDGTWHEERINNGEPYPSNYDKPHALNVVANYKFSRRFSVSSNLVYSTGRPITYPVGFFYHDVTKIPLYSQRNEYRVPDYFRIDLSLKIEGNLLSRKFAHGTWILSVYNLTGRKNAYSVFFRTEDELLKGYKLSVFGVPIVSLTYSFKLGNYAN